MMSDHTFNEIARFFGNAAIVKNAVLCSSSKIYRTNALGGVSGRPEKAGDPAETPRDPPHHNRTARSSFVVLSSRGILTGVLCGL